MAACTPPGCSGQIEDGHDSACGPVGRPAPPPRDLVAGESEIRGTVALGGSGLFDSKDPGLLDAAALEREYLTALKHPNIIAIDDFVTHGPEGAIVVEHVNGRTLMTLRKERVGPLPVAEAISYALEILPFSDLYGVDRALAARPIPWT
jgi:serine/threonine-protein kinase PknG